MAQPPLPPNRPPAAARPRRRWTRLVPWLGGAALVLLIAVGLWPEAQPVEIADVRRGPLAVTVDEVGMTRVRNRYVVSSPVGGLLRRIPWKAGADVEAGQTVLAELDTRGADLLDARSQAEAEARVRAAGAARAQADARRHGADAEAAQARTDLARMQALFDSGSVSRQELDAAALRDTSAAQAARAAAFAQQVAEFELQQAQAVLQRGTDGGGGEPLVITAPVSGRVLRVFQESERVVPAGIELLELGDPTDIEARIEVLSRDGVAIRPGARVDLVKWGGDQPLHGRVRLVEPSAFTKISALGVEEQRVNVIVDFTDPPAARPTLGDAYRVEARIVTWESPDVLQVPAGALFQTGERWQTYVYADGRAHRRDVQPGHGNGFHTEILGGLAPGEQVVVYPGDKIEDGIRVAPMSVPGAN